jgi:hypothetical protein
MALESILLTVGVGFILTAAVLRRLGRHRRSRRDARAERGTPSERA